MRSRAPTSSSIPQGEGRGGAAAPRPRSTPQRALTVHSDPHVQPRERAPSVPAPTPAGRPAAPTKDTERVPPAEPPPLAPRHRRPMHHRPLHSSLQTSTTSKRRRAKSAPDSCTHAGRRSRRPPSSGRRRTNSAQPSSEHPPRIRLFLDVVLPTYRSTLRHAGYRRTCEPPNGWRCAALPGQAADAQMRRVVPEQSSGTDPTGTWRRADEGGASATSQSSHPPSPPRRRQRQHQRIVGWRRGDCQPVNVHCEQPCA